MERENIITLIIVVGIAIVAFNLDTITGKEVAPTVRSVTISPNVIRDRGDITITVDYIGRIENEVSILRGDDGGRWVKWDFDSCGSSDLCIQSKSPATLTKLVNIDRSNSRTRTTESFKPGLYYIRINDRWGREIAREPFKVE